MKLVTAIVRPEKVMDVIKALEESGYFAFSKWAISGRGKEKGIQVGDVLYQEMAKACSISPWKIKKKMKWWILLSIVPRAESMVTMEMEKFLCQILKRHIRSARKHGKTKIEQG